MFVRTSINFATLACFQSIEFVDRLVPKTLDIFEYEMSVWSMVLSKAFSKFARNAWHYDTFPPPTAYQDQERERPAYSDSDSSSNNKSSFIILVVSITKFSIVTGSPRAYLSRNRRVITRVSDYRCPIWTFSNGTPVIGCSRDFYVNYARFNGFLSNVFYSFQNLG